MDIRNWSLDQILMLPDHCFGRRWPIGLRVLLVDDAAVYDIAEGGLPETTVIWGLTAAIQYKALGDVSLSVALGDHLPANDAEFDVMEQVFPEVIGPTLRRSEFEVVGTPSYPLQGIRQVLQTAGRRFVIRGIRDEGTAAGAWCIFIVSSIPREVPDCLLSV